MGKLAAPNEDLADPNAFIITDEETVIPAAPPADEVVISSFKAESTPDEVQMRTNSPFWSEDGKEDWVAAGFRKNSSSRECPMLTSLSSPTDESAVPDILDLSFSEIDCKNAAQLAPSPNENNMVSHVCSSNVDFDS